MATNDFLAFAGDPAANVMTQADYISAGFTARLLGFSTGTALSVQLNKVWRQASLISHMIGQFTSDEINQDMLDDGTPGGLAALQTHFRQAITTVAQGAVGVGYLPLTGGTLTGPLYINAPTLQIQAPAGQSGSVNLVRQAGQYTSINGYTGASARWQISLPDNAPEVGANAGSNLDINSFNDAGAYLDTPMSINRATGVVNFSRPPTVGGALLPYVPIAGGQMTGPLGVGGQGINYPGLGGNFLSHRTAFGWDSSFVVAAVDGVYVGQLATVGWSNTLVGNYLPLTGGTLSGQLNINSGLYVAAASGFRSSVWFANVGDFINFWDGRFRYRQWAGSWFDSWDGQTGNRTWYCAGGQSMFLDGVANFQVSGAIRAYGSRILSLGGAPSVCAYSTSAGVAKGMWVDGSGLWLGQMDGSGNPTRADTVFDNNGYMTLYGSGQCNGSFYVAGSLHCANFDVSGQISCYQLYASYSQIWGNETVNGQFLAGGNIISNTGLIIHGAAQIDSTFNCSAGAYAQYIRSYGDGQFDGNLNCNNSITSHNGRLMSLGNPGQQPTVTAWSVGDGNAMGFQVVNQMNFGHMDGGGNYQGGGGHLMSLANNGLFVLVPVYYPSSTLDRKTNVRAAGSFDSLRAICATPTNAFDWIAGGGHVEHGFIVEQLRETIPDAVVVGPDSESPTGKEFLDPLTMMAHLFRAIAQLDDKIERMAHG
jgi:hypothetical protein